MGCSSSKDTPAGMKASGSSIGVDAATTTESKNISSMAMDFFLSAEPAIGLAGLFFGGGGSGGGNSSSKATTSSSKSSIPHTPATMESSNTKSKVKKRCRFQNICAPPIDDWTKFVPPNHPKSEMENDFIATSLKSIFCFNTLSEKELQTLIDAFVQIEVPKDNTVITQGEGGDYFYMIRNGIVHYEVNHKNVGQAKRGHCFGELALLYTSPRAATVIADTDCILYKVDQKTFRYTLQMQTLQSEKDKLDLLVGVNFLKELDISDLNKLINMLVPRKFDAGEYIVKKGEEGDTFYLIQEGKVNVTDISIGHTNYEDQVLSSGDYFGERALITKEPRTANCIGKTSGIVLTIDKQTFERAIGNLSKLVLKCQDKRQLVR